jgi:hypothetical protein
MDEAETPDLMVFVERVWASLANRTTGEDIPYENVAIATVTAVQIEVAKKAGMDMVGYQHTLSSTSIHHIREHHGNAKKEHSRGNIVVTEDDFAAIPDILATPDYIIAGIKIKNESRILYAKNYTGTTFYVEQAQVKRKYLASQAFYKSSTAKGMTEIIKEMETNKDYDLSKVEKYTSASGSNPTFAPHHDGRTAAANPASNAGTIGEQPT